MVRDRVRKMTERQKESYIVGWSVVDCKKQASYLVRERGREKLLGELSSKSITHH